MKIPVLRRFWACLAGCSVLIFGCATSTEMIATPTATLVQTKTDPSSPSPTPKSTQRTYPTDQPSTTTPIPTMEICSPLEGISLGELPGIIFNPFNPPPPGSDDPHQGVDFSDLAPITQISREGRPVQTNRIGHIGCVGGHAVCEPHITGRNLTEIVDHDCVA